MFLYQVWFPVEMRIGGTHQGVLPAEKWRGQQRFIGIVEVDGEEPNEVRQIINQPEIEKEIRTFYANLYRERPTRSSDADLQGFMGDTELLLASQGSVVSSIKPSGRI